MNTVKCPNCGQENKNTNIRCESCGTELNPIEQNDNFLNKDYSHTNVTTIDLESKKVKHITHISIVIWIFIFAPWFLIGLALIGVSSYSNISDNNKSKNYLETEGKLVSYDKCQFDDDGDELCNVVYEYTVNGVTYKGSPNLLSNRPKQTATVKYNPNNPSEYVMNSGWNELLMVGIIMVIVSLIMSILIQISVLIIFISIKFFIKKLSTILKRQSGN